MSRFLLILVGQGLSLLGSMAALWSVGFWVFDETHSQTLFALTALAGTLPVIVVSVFAGVWVDRVSKRRAMLTADGVAMIGPVVLAIVASLPQPPIAGLALAVAIGSLCSAFLRPAFFAASTLCVERDLLPRIAGLSQAMWGAATLAAPIVGAVLVTHIGLRGVAIVDLCTFAIAIATTLAARIAEPAKPPARDLPSYRADLRAGFQLIGRDRSLVVLLAFFACLNLVWSMYEGLLLPTMVRMSDATTASRVMMLGGAGAILGSLVVGWQRPSNAVRAMQLAAVAVVAGVAAHVCSSIYAVAAAAFAVGIAVGLLNALSQVIWQIRVPPDMQGRAFAVRGTIAWSTVTLGYLVIGPLIDHVLTPLMAAPDLLAQQDLARRVGFLVLAGVGAVGAAILWTAPRESSP